MFCFCLKTCGGNSRAYHLLAWALLCYASCWMFTHRASFLVIVTVKKEHCCSLISLSCLDLQVMAVLHYVNCCFSFYLYCFKLFSLLKFVVLDTSFKYISHFSLYHFKFFRKWYDINSWRDSVGSMAALTAWQSSSGEGLEPGLHTQH